MHVSISLSLGINHASSDVTVDGERIEVISLSLGINHASSDVTVDGERIEVISLNRGINHASVSLGLTEARYERIHSVCASFPLILGGAIRHSNSSSAKRSFHLK